MLPRVHVHMTKSEHGAHGANDSGSMPPVVQKPERERDQRACLSRHGLSDREGAAMPQSAIPAPAQLLASGAGRAKRPRLLL